MRRSARPEPEPDHRQYFPTNPLIGVAPSHARPHHLPHLDSSVNPLIIVVRKTYHQRRRVTLFLKKTKNKKHPRLYYLPAAMTALHGFQLFITFLEAELRLLLSQLNLAPNNKIFTPRPTYLPAGCIFTAAESHFYRLLQIRLRLF